MSKRNRTKGEKWKNRELNMQSIIQVDSWPWNLVEEEEEECGSVHFESGFVVPFSLLWVEWEVRGWIWLLL